MGEGIRLKVGPARQGELFSFWALQREHLMVVALSLNDLWTIAKRLDDCKMVNCGGVNLNFNLI